MFVLISSLKSSFIEREWVARTFYAYQTWGSHGGTLKAKFFFTCDVLSCVIGRVVSDVWNVDSALMTAWHRTWRVWDPLKRRGLLNDPTSQHMIQIHHFLFHKKTLVSYSMQLTFICHSSQSLTLLQWCLFLARHPLVGQDLLINEVSRSHTTTHHSL